MGKLCDSHIKSLEKAQSESLWGVYVFFSPLSFVKFLWILRPIRQWFRWNSCAGASVFRVKSLPQLWIIIKTYHSPVTYKNFMKFGNTLRFTRRKIIFHSGIISLGFIVILQMHKLHNFHLCHHQDKFILNLQSNVHVCVIEKTRRNGFQNKLVQGLFVDAAIFHMLLARMYSIFPHR